MRFLVYLYYTQPSTGPLLLIKIMRIVFEFLRYILIGKSCLQLIRLICLLNYHPNMAMGWTGQPVRPRLCTRNVTFSMNWSVIDCCCSLEDDALMDPFNVYLQTLLSQALDSDFLEALQHENGKNRLSSQLLLEQVSTSDDSRTLHPNSIIHNYLCIKQCVNGSHKSIRHRRRRVDIAQSNDYCMGAHPPFQRFEPARVKPN